MSREDDVLRARFDEFRSTLSNIPLALRLGFRSLHLKFEGIRCLWIEDIPTKVDDINTLKSFVGKLPLMASDKICRDLMQAGIEPDFIVSLGETPSHFEGLNFGSRSSLIAPLSIDSRSLEYFKTESIIFLLESQLNVAHVGVMFPFLLVGVGAINSVKDLAQAAAKFLGLSLIYSPTECCGSVNDIQPLKTEVTAASSIERINERLERAYRNAVDVRRSHESHLEKLQAIQKHFSVLLQELQSADATSAMHSMDLFIDQIIEFKIGAIEESKASLTFGVIILPAHNALDEELQRDSAKFTSLFEYKKHWLLRNQEHLRLWAESLNNLISCFNIYMNALNQFQNKGCVQAPASVNPIASLGAIEPFFP